MCFINKSVAKNIYVLKMQRFIQNPLILFLRANGLLHYFCISHPTTCKLEKQCCRGIKGVVKK